MLTVPSSPLRGLSAVAMGIAVLAVVGCASGMGTPEAGSACVVGTWEQDLEASASEGVQQSGFYVITLDEATIAYDIDASTRSEDVGEQVVQGKAMQSYSLDGDILTLGAVTSASGTVVTRTADGEEASGDFSPNTNLDVTVACGPETLTLTFGGGVEQSFSRR